MTLRFVSLLFLFLHTSPFLHAQKLKDILDKAKSTLQKPAAGALTQGEVGAALREALDKGVGEAVSRLSANDGYHASVYKILLPEEARVVVERLKVVPGFQRVESDLILRMNRAAELAAKEAGPIFLGAIQSLTFADAMGILKGKPDAATRYLEGKTDSALTAAFLPSIGKALDAVNARTLWRDAVSAYNRIPLVQKVNPELDRHVTDRSLDGMFALIEVKEKTIRTEVSARTTDTLRKVFGSLDKPMP